MEKGAQILFVMAKVINGTEGMRLNRRKRCKTRQAKSKLPVIKILFICHGKSD